jgi:para-nitrobenzyl esterase
MMQHRTPYAWILTLVAVMTWLGVGGGVASASAAPATAASVVRSPVVHTDKGAVQGVTKRGVDSYLGVRYAKAPVGPLRWHPPQPAAAWSGVLATTSYGSRCPQLANDFDGAQSLTEDCLFLDVERPSSPAAGSRLPVYVFIHGGGLVNGSSNRYDGTSIVQQTGVIVVTINYRLGAFGFLGLPELTAQQGESGNYGLQDEIAALAWVHRNIASFGGDPRRVTVGGESAGAYSVCALLSTPSSAGLFSAAIMQSGYCDSGSQSDAENSGQAFAGAAGCIVPAHVLACLQHMGPKALLTWWDNVGDPNFVVSGTPTVPLAPLAAVMHGKIHNIPVLIGANRDEGRTFTAGSVGAMDKAGYESWLQDNIPGPRIASVEARYPWPSNADQFTGAYLTGAIITDSGLFGIGGCVNRDFVNALAKSTPTFAYEFDHRTGPGVNPQPAGYVWGAGHAAELAYLWPSFNNGTPIAPTFNEGERQLSTQMIAYWGAFVENGRPSAAGQPHWPAMSSSQSLLSLRAGNTSTVITDAALSREHQCGYWG